MSKPKNRCGVHLVKNMKRARKLEKRGEELGYLKEHDCFCWKPKAK